LPFSYLKAALAALLLALMLLGGCGAGSDAGDDALAASQPRVRLLTAQQYSNSIAQVFGEDVGASVIAPLPPLPRTDGLLANGAAFVAPTSDQVSQIQQAAAAIAAAVVDDDHRDFLLPCRPHSTTDADRACATTFLRDSGRLLFRRPLSDRRLDEVVAIAERAAGETEDFYQGLALALETLLISPEFLFIIDRSEPDPDRPGEERLDAYSLASRLSFFLWNSAPDEALLRAAESGALHSAKGRAEAVDRLLASPRLEAGMRAFFDDMLAFDDFDSLAKDPEMYPMVTAKTLADAREQTLRTIIDHLLTKEADYRDLFTTRKTYMSMALAAVYGTPTGEGWVEHEFSADSHRRGLLTHVSFLAANSHAVRSSPTLRGKAMRELLLCQHVPDPPPDVDFSKLEDAGDVATARERLQVHNTNPACAGCHLITDPMGLSLENFDGAGSYRETENGAELDIAGELDGVFYDDVDGLADAMRNHPKLSYCLVNRLYAYGTGGPVSLKHDRDVLKWFEAGFVADGYSLPALLRDISTSPVFSGLRATPEVPEVRTAEAKQILPSTAASREASIAASVGVSERVMQNTGGGASSSGSTIGTKSASNSASSNADSTGADR
jgi:hypothetical protein